MDPVSSDLLDAAGDVPQTGDDGVTVSIHRPLAVAAAAWRAWTCDSRTRARNHKTEE